MKRILLACLLALAACNSDDETKAITLGDLNGTWKEVIRHSLSNTRGISCNNADPKLFVFYETTHTGSIRPALTILTVGKTGQKKAVPV